MFSYVCVELISSNQKHTMHISVSAKMTYMHKYLAFICWQGERRWSPRWHLPPVSLRYEWLSVSLFLQLSLCETETQWRQDKRGCHSASAARLPTCSKYHTTQQLMRYLAVLAEMLEYSISLRVTAGWLIPAQLWHWVVARHGCRTMRWLSVIW